jgi:hypothetical protein
VRIRAKGVVAITQNGELNSKCAVHATLIALRCSMTVVRTTPSIVVLRNQQKHGPKNITTLVKHLGIMTAAAARSLTDCGWSHDVGPSGLTTLSGPNAKHQWTDLLTPPQTSMVTFQCLVMIILHFVICIVQYATESRDSTPGHLVLEPKYSPQIILMLRRKFDSCCFLNLDLDLGVPGRIRQKDTAWAR